MQFNAIGEEKSIREQFQQLQPAGEVACHSRNCRGVQEGGNGEKERKEDACRVKVFLLQGIKMSQASFRVT